MKIYIPYHAGGAGLWVYMGYYNAWKLAGYDVEYYSHISEVDTSIDEYTMMATEGGIYPQAPGCYEVLEKASKVYMFAQPHTFPAPWGSHPNFVTAASDEFVSKVNQMDHVHLWSFANTSGTDFWAKWKTVHHIPLAFDTEAYDVGHNPSDEFKYDVCYIGGYADNGFNEKAQVMSEYFSALEERGINTDGIFINKNISIEHEAKVLRASKISLNIHDRYQHDLGLDCNERTFKSLGLNGFLVSDKVECLDSLGSLVVLQGESPKDVADIVEEFLDKDSSYIKELNRSMVRRNHTYLNRVNQMICL